MRCMNAADVVCFNGSLRYGFQRFVVTCRIEECLLSTAILSLSLRSPTVRRNLDEIVNIRWVLPLTWIAVCVECGFRVPSRSKRRTLRQMSRIYWVVTGLHCLFVTHVPSYYIYVCVSCANIIPKECSAIGIICQVLYCNTFTRDALREENTLLDENF